jgi:hypothetical protein
VGQARVVLPAVDGSARSHPPRRGGHARRGAAREGGA